LAESLLYYIDLAQIYPFSTGNQIQYNASKSEWILHNSNIDLAQIYPFSTGSSAARPDPVHNASKSEWILHNSNIDLAQICPFSTGSSHLTGITTKTFQSRKQPPNGNHNQDLPVKETSITPRSTIESLEKRMELCFGAVPDISTDLTTRPLKHKRSYLDDDLNDYAILTMVEHISGFGQVHISGSMAEEMSPEKAYRLLW